ncbi:MAG: hypothetical protein GY805_02900 [Chloroflexi bacterium]|nr:hypothetical protein [Chloroflexota bacterium]
MNNDFYDGEIPHRGFDEWETPQEQGGWLDGLRQLWQWDELAAEIGQENQARVAFVGLFGVGKSLLFNRLRGWDISGDVQEGLTNEDNFGDAALSLNEHFGEDSSLLNANLKLESLGLFILADLPHPTETVLTSRNLLLALGEPALIIYLLDGSTGVTPSDYRWVAALRAAGKPLLLALNKCDLIESITAVLDDTVQKLGMSAIPISATTGQNVEEKLLPAMLDAVPRLAVPLGRELIGLRRVAAHRVMRQAALFAGLMGAQPVPILDLPFQVMIQVGVVMRIGAAYGYVPTGSLNREVISTVVGSLGIRYAALALVKFIPFVGWAVAGYMSGAMTFLI